MKNKKIDINDLANELGVSRQNLNFHILQGRAGDVQKVGDGKTHEMILTIENVLQLVKFLMGNGRSNRLKLIQVKRKYEQLNNE